MKWKNILLVNGLTTLFLSASALAFTIGANFWAHNLPTVGELEKLKELLPSTEDKTFLDKLILVVQQEKTRWYEAKIWLTFAADTEQDLQALQSTIERITVAFPEGSSVSNPQELAFEKTYRSGEQFVALYSWSKKYDLLSALRADFKEGFYEYLVDYHSQPQENKFLQLPQIQYSSFPDVMQNATISWIANTLQLCMPSPISEIEMYEISGWDIRKNELLFQQSNLPYYAYYYRDGLAKKDMRVDIAYRYPYQPGYEGYYAFGTVTSIYDFRSTVLNGSGISVSKCNVTAGINNQDTFLMSGKFYASEINFKNANLVRVALNSSYMPKPLIVEFPTDTPNPLVNNKFFKKITDPNTLATYEFKYDNKTKIFSFSANRADLTGMACPITVVIYLESLLATGTLDEDIVNNSRPCPYELLMGAVDDLQVQKYQLVKGKTAGNDRFTMQGKFAIDGVVELDDNGKPINPFLLKLGEQQAEIAGTKFTIRNGIYSCSNLLEDEGVFTIRLDFNKATYNISVSKAALEVKKGDGLVDVGMGVFGKELFDFAAVNL